MHRMGRKQKLFYVESDVVSLVEDESGLLHREFLPHSQLVIDARGPTHAEELATDNWPGAAVVRTVLSVRHERLAYRMLEGDSYNPDLDYARGALEEEREEWGEPGR